MNINMIEYHEPRFFFNASENGDVCFFKGVHIPHVVHQSPKSEFSRQQQYLRNSFYVRHNGLRGGELYLSVKSQRLRARTGPKIDSHSWCAASPR